MRRYNLLIGLIAILAIVLIFQVVRSNSKYYKANEELNQEMIENATLSERVNCLEEMLRNCQNNKVVEESTEVEEKEEVKEVEDAKSDEPVIKIITDKKQIKPKPQKITPKPQKKTTIVSTPEPEKKEEKVVPAKVYEPRIESTEYYFPAHFYEPGTEGVKFCVRLGGNEKRHLPHLAIVNGHMNIEPNGISGYNWVVGGPVSDPVGDWGITNDKMFFVSVDMIEQFLKPDDNGIVELKAPATNWKPVRMEKFGDYYVCQVE
ncbi:MAG: hypothetical protein PF488_01135 [Patescibacteria group bacterium]|jgi:hypothetical protein|nr:hypothetical protein [Patescibacteria group bacterium]